MKKVILFLTVIAIAAVAFGFQSLQGYSYGNADAEYTVAVVDGSKTINVGEWVAIKNADTQSLDTCAVVTTTGTENSAMLLGVAMETGKGGSIIRIMTRGFTTAYISGVDSGGVSQITNGTPLASSIRAGRAGAAASQMTVVPVASTPCDTAVAITAAQAAVTRICGYALATVATTDTGLYNRYDVYVRCR